MGYLLESCVSGACWVGVSAPVNNAMRGCVFMGSWDMMVCEALRVDTGNGFKVSHVAKMSALWSEDDMSAE